MPLSRIVLSCSSVTSLPCSMESAPASIAIWMLVVVAAWTATLQVLAVGLIDDRRHFRRRDVVLDRDLDDVDVVEDDSRAQPGAPRRGCLSARIPAARWIRPRAGLRLCRYEPERSVCVRRPEFSGPGTRPALMASRNAASPSMPECPRLRTVVNPLSRSSRADLRAPQDAFAGRHCGDRQQESREQTRRCSVRALSASVGTHDIEK